MGYQFSNNWPYSESGFPTMVEHVDPVNNEYFTGLNTELINIERILGLMVSSGFATVKDKLELHNHTGGNHGVPLVPSEVVVWKKNVYFDQWWETRIDVSKGASNSGFQYFDLIYTGPFERDTGSRGFIWFRNVDQSHGHQFTSDPDYEYQPRNAHVVGNIAYITSGHTVLLKFNIDTWGEGKIALGGGATGGGMIVEVGDYLYFPCATTPIKLVRVKKSDDSLTYYDMNAGEGPGFACATDGEYIYMATDTNPIKILRFKIADSTHDTFEVEGFSAEVRYMCVVGNFLYVFNRDGTTKFIRLNLSTQAYQIFTPDWPANIYCGTIENPFILLNTFSPSDNNVIVFNPSTFVSYVTVVIGDRGRGRTFVYNDGYVHLGLVSGNDHNYIGHMTLPSE